MDRLTNYSDLLRESICEIVVEIPPQEGIRTEYEMDEARGRYEIIEAGWVGPRRVHGILLH